MDSITQKRCPKCGKVKLFSFFGKNKHRKDGLQDWCKSCRSESAHENLAVNRVKKNEWRTLNRDKVCEKKRIWYKENIERERAANKRYRDANLEKERKRRRKWEIENPEKRKKSQREWGQKNPEKMAEYAHRRRSLKLGNGGTITAQEWRDLKKKYNYTCLCCRKEEPEIKLTLDHVSPLSAPFYGKNVISNAQPLCGVCNSRKGANYIDYR